jgi:hypothetical protein
MTDYILSKLINGGARIKMLRSTLLDEPPQKTFDISPHDFILLEKLIGWLDKKETREFHKDCIDCKNTHCKFNGRNIELVVKCPELIL